MTALRRLWTGELPLQDAFWGWAVIGGLILNVLTTAVFLLLISLDHPVPALIVGYAIPIPYNLFMILVVWRSADRYTGDRRWADWAKAITIGLMIVFSLT